ncbi:YdcF family protein [Salinilacihabitans rarus]|uniref:YdcF family protein n=1 Tax=Salinilacihabitans rarus TaxID=2961596 RepID=UPI0020C8E01D|nr:YdcF family protein [Salinilacihabitans rarus]
MVVVTLGHRLAGDAIHPHLRARVDAGITAVRETTASALVFTGGHTNPAVPRAECEVMREYALERGVDPDRIVVEDRALDTVGNGYFSRRLVDDLDRTVDSLFLVTADYHVPRSRYVFEQCFGTERRIDTSYAVSTATSPECPAERRSFRSARRFFDSISPGDVEAIERRLITNHECYDARHASSSRV